MTPIRLIQPDISPTNSPFPVFRTKHMCRNFESLKHWATKVRTANKELDYEHIRKIKEDAKQLKLWRG